MRLDFQDITLRFARLPDALDGIRIWHLSDLHGVPGRRVFTDARKILDANDAEMLVVTGDLCASWRAWNFSLDVVEELLTPVRWPLGFPRIFPYKGKWAV